MNLIELATPLVEQLRAEQLKVQIAIQKKQSMTIESAAPPVEQLSDEQIIANFKKAFISIRKVETKGRENGMICTIYRDTPKFFPTYYDAWNFYKSKNLL